MDHREHFQKYRSRLVGEGVIKAVICGLTIGFSVDFLVALITWLAGADGLWLSIGLGFISAAVSAPIFYYRRFRPTAKSVARRLDRLGLEERLITMTELEGDESYIALRQREDAQQKLQTVDRRQIKFLLSRAGIVSVCVLAVLGISMTTVSTLSAQGRLPGGVIDPPASFSVTYSAKEGGEILGECSQTVSEGGSATTVVAVAADGWMFDHWSDGISVPSRTDTDIRADLSLAAIFVEVGDSSQDPGSQDRPDDRPDGEAGDGPGSGTPGIDPGDGTGGKYEDNNQIIDGKTYYREVYQAYYDQAMKILAEGGEIPDGLRAIIESYFGIIL